MSECSTLEVGDKRRTEQTGLVAASHVVREGHPSRVGGSGRGAGKERDGTRLRHCFLPVRLNGAFAIPPYLYRSTESVRLLVRDSEPTPVHHVDGNSLLDAL